MLKARETLISEDFPEYEVDVRRPKPDEWGDFQTAARNRNAQEGMLNLLIACGTVYRIGADGKRVERGDVPKLGELVDEWSTLPEFATGAAGMLCGSFDETANAIRLDLPAILAAAERVKAWGVEFNTWSELSDKPTRPIDPSAEDRALAKLAERCAMYGLDADVMRATIKSHPRRGSYAAFVVDDVGAFVFERPRFAAWSAYDRTQRRDKLGASVALVSACTAFPDRGHVAMLLADLPGFVTNAADIIERLREDIRADVKKDVTLSDKPAQTDSLPLPS